MADALFRRQRAIIGAAAAEQVALLHVLLVGLRGVGAEIAKCLVLTGVRCLTLLDDDLVREEDFAANFLLHEGDRGKPKAKLLAARLNALCPFADVLTIPGALTLDLLLNYHVVVFSSSQFSREELIAYNEFCRVQSPPVGFVLAESRGALGMVFTDFSSRHIAEDADALVEFRVLTKRSQVTTVNDDTFATLHVRESYLNSAVGPGDSVDLRNAAAGGNELPHAASSLQTGRQTLVCQVTRVLSPTCVEVRVPVPANCSEQLRRELQSRAKVATHLRKLARRSTTAAMHRSLRERIVDPGEIALPFEHSDVKAASAHLAMQALYAYRQEFGAYPESNNREQLRQMLELSRKFSHMNTCALLESSRGSLGRSPAQPMLCKPDEELVRLLLRCPASEFQPLSALVAGYAAIQVMKFAGKLGPPVHAQSQLLYFDILSTLPPELDERSAALEFAIPTPRRENAIIALFGASFLQRLERTVLCLVGAEATSVEMLKNALCLGVGASAHIQIVARDASVNIRTNPAAVGLLASTLEEQSGHSTLLAFATEHFPTAKLEVCSMEERSQRSAWNQAHVVCGDSLSVPEKLWVDAQCRACEKPFVFVDQCPLRARISAFVPHMSATFAESLIPPETTANAQLFAFDHLPTTPAPGIAAPALRVTTWTSEGKCAASQQQRRTDGFAAFEVGEMIARGRALLQLVFSDSVALAVGAFERAVAASSVASLPPASDIATVWAIWSVVQRGHNTSDFASCVVEAWRLCELVPTLLLCGERGCSPSLPATAGNDDDITMLLVLDVISDPDHTQLLVAMACILADSLSIPVPPVVERRKIVAHVASDTSVFSLHTSPRTRSGILASFAAASAEHLLRVCKRVQLFAFDADAVEMLHHSYALQSLVNIQAKAHAAPRLPDLAALRAAAGARVDCIPIASITGALAVLEVVKLLLMPSKRNELCSYELTLPSLANGYGGLGAFRLELRALPAPLQMRSLTHEATRGVPLRVVPECFTAWSKISVARSPELQSVGAIVAFIQTKYRVQVHALLHDRCVVLTLDDARKQQPDDLAASVFDVVARVNAASGGAVRHENNETLETLLLDVVATDAHGDVVFAPFRIQRCATLCKDIKSSREFNDEW